MGFSRQEHWSELPFPSPGDLPNPGVEPRSPTLQADTLTSAPPGKLDYSVSSPKWGFFLGTAICEPGWDCGVSHRLIGYMFKGIKCYI